VLIGETVRNKLFGGQNPVGSEIASSSSLRSDRLLESKGQFRHGL